jgi:hypothetical protein
MLRLHAGSREASGESGDRRDPFRARQPQQEPGRGVFDRPVDLNSAEAEIAALQSTDLRYHRHRSHHQDPDQRFQTIVILVEHVDAQTLELKVVETLEILFVSVTLSHVS